MFLFDGHTAYSFIAFATLARGHMCPVETNCLPEGIICCICIYSGGKKNILVLNFFLVEAHFSLSVFLIICSRIF